MVDVRIKLAESLIVLTINASTIKYLLMDEGFLIEDTNLYGLLMELETEENE